VALAVVRDVVIDSPRWLDGWGEPTRLDRGGEASSAGRIQPLPPRVPARPALTLVGDGGHRRPSPVVARRRRAVLVLAFVAGIAGLWLSATWATQPASAASVDASEVRRTHVVEPGDTYWSIAAAVTPDGTDLRLAVDALIDANGGRALFTGDRVELP
jgi:hypothetical protein